MPTIYFVNNVESAVKVLTGYAFDDDQFDAAVEYLQANDADNPVLADALEFSRNRQMLRELNAMYAADDAIKEGDERRLIEIRKFLVKSEDKSVRDFAVQLPEEQKIEEKERPVSSEVSSSSTMNDNVREIEHALEEISVQSFTDDPDSLAGDLMKKTEFVYDDGKPVTQSTQEEYLDTIVEVGKEEAAMKFAGDTQFHMQSLEEKKQQLFAFMDETLSKNIVDMATESQIGERKNNETDEEYENRAKIAINKVKHQIQVNQPLRIKQSALVKHVAHAVRSGRQYLKKLLNRGKNVVAKMFEPRVQALEEKSNKLFGKRKVEHTKKVVTGLKFRRWKKIAKNIVMGVVVALCLGGATYGAYSLFSGSKTNKKEQVKGSNKANDAKTYKIQAQDFQKSRADSVTTAKAAAGKDADGFYEKFPDFNAKDGLSLEHYNEINDKMTGMLSRQHDAFEKWNKEQIEKYGDKATLIPVKDPETMKVEALNNIHALNTANPEFLTITLQDGSTHHLTDMETLYLYMKNVEYSEKTVKGPKVNRVQYLISDLDDKGNPQFASMPEAMSAFDQFVRCGDKITVPVEDIQKLLSRIDLETGNGLTPEFSINVTGNYAVGILGRDCPDGVPAHTGSNLWKSTVAKVKRLFMPKRKPAPAPISNETPKPTIKPDVVNKSVPHIEDVPQKDLVYAGNGHVKTNAMGSKTSAGAIGEYNGEGKGDGDYLGNMKGNPIKRTEISGTEVLIKNVKGGRGGQ